jgi:hypothetical protein
MFSCGSTCNSLPSIIKSSRFVAPPRAKVFPVLKSPNTSTALPIDSLVSSVLRVHTDEVLELRNDNLLAWVLRRQVNLKRARYLLARALGAAPALGHAIDVILDQKSTKRRELSVVLKVDPGTVVCFRQNWIRGPFDKSTECPCFCINVMSCTECGYRKIHIGFLGFAFVSHVMVPSVSASMPSPICTHAPFFHLKIRTATILASCERALRPKCP